MQSFLMLNCQWHCLFVSRYYHPIIRLDVRDLHLVCEQKNYITISLERPRSNIDQVSSVFQFFFHEFPPTAQHLGEVISKCHCHFNTENTKYSESLPCILFLRGNELVEILFYLPPRPTLFLRELMFRTSQTILGECVICLETKPNLIPCHEGHFEKHVVCLACLLLLTELRCPLCRQPIALLPSLHDDDETGT